MNMRKEGERGSEGEREGGGERGTGCEKYQSVASCTHAEWGSNLQPRYVP